MEFLSTFLPDFSILLKSNDFYSFDTAQTATWITALVCGLLITIFVFFSISVLMKYFSAQRRIHFFRKRIKPLKSQNAEELAQNRRELQQKMKRNKTYGAIWEEFDQSLVEARNPSRLYNTIDAEYFFNNHTLASGLTENRLLAAVPGFLTAIGVIGTFIGLTFGLKQIDLNGSADTMKIGIVGLINGAASAFLTSVWGVLSSLLFNWFEKHFESKVKKNIHRLQTDINNIFPRIVAEQSLHNIEFISQGSHNHLAELSEKIGYEMQKVMEQSSSAISQSIVDSLSTALMPAIDKLVNNANEGSEKALEALIQEFLNKIGNAGQMQKDAMTGATQALSDSSQKMMENLTKFTEQLDNKIEDIRRGNQEILGQMQSAFSSQFNDMREHQLNAMQGIQSSLGSISENNQQTLTKLTEVIDQFMQKLTALLGEFNRSSQETVNGMNNSITQQSETQQKELQSFIEMMSEQLATFQQNSSHMMQSLEQILSDKINQQSDQMAKREENITSSTNEFMQSLANSIDELSRNTANMLQTTEKVLIERANEQVKQDTLRSEQLTQELSSAISELNRNNTEMLKAIEKMISERINQQAEQDAQRATKINQQVENGSKLQKELADSMNDAISQQTKQSSELSEKINEMLNSFKQLAEVNKSGSEAMEKAANNIQNSSMHFAHLSDSLKLVTTDFSQKLHSTLSMADRLFNENNNVAILFNKAGDKINYSSELINQATNNLENTAQTTKAGFEAMQQHFNQLAAALRSHIAELNNQVSELLTNYSQSVIDQTNNRLNVWNQQTNEYSSAMKDAINTLSSVVDEIDGKIARK